MKKHLFKIVLFGGIAAIIIAIGIVTLSSYLGYQSYLNKIENSKTETSLVIR